MKCHYCGHNIKEGFLTVDDVIKAGRFHQIKCPKCGEWCEVITAVVNAYGMKASDVTYISDILFQTIKDGKITGQELAQSLGRAISWI